jgi:hypothetical protein
MFGITGAAIGNAVQFIAYGALMSRAAEAKTSIRTHLFSPDLLPWLRLRGRYVS